MSHDALDELDRITSWDGANGFHLCPLGELVDSDIEVAVAPWHSREGAQDIQPPDRERPREWYSLEALSWLMYLLGMELAGLTRFYQLCYVVDCRGPRKSTTECLADEGL